LCRRQRSGNSGITRYRKALIQDRTREVNRLHKVLEDAGIKLATVATDVLGVAGRAMLAALLAGTADPAVLADLARGRMRAKLPALRQALTGRFRARHAFLIGQILARLDSRDETLAALSREIATPRTPLASAITRLRTIPGVEQRTSEVLVTEIGVDMSRFPTAGHLVSGAGLCPGNNESAGKRYRRTPRKGCKWLRITLIEAALGAIRKKGCVLGARYRRIMRHREHKVAVVAIARTILEVAYHLLTRETTYQELGADYFDRRDKERATHRSVRLLEQLGYHATLEDRHPSLSEW